MEQNEFEINPRERVYALLDRLGIRYEIVEHPAMFSAVDNKLHERDINATIFKNLFLRNKDKSRYYLYSLPIMKRADLAALATHIGETRFSFGNENELWDKLRIRPGSVSPLNVIDAPGTDVEVLIDRQIFACGRFGIHPNDNTVTVILAPHDLMKILDAVGCRYRAVEIEQEFHTERLLLRPWRQDDAPSLFKYASDPLVGPICGWPPHTSVENSAEIIKSVLSAAETYAVVLKDTGEPVGSIGLMREASAHSAAFGTNEAEIGYWIGVPCWGNGFIPEAVRELLRHSFEDLGLEAVWCGYYDGNEKSKRVQDKCGFRYHHTESDKPCPMLDERRTEHFTRLTRQEWKSRSYGTTTTPQ